MEERLGGRESHCPVCRASVEPEFLICPVCTTKLRQACVTCKQPLEALWQVCPFCETPVEPQAVESLGQTQALTPPLSPPRRERSA
jgi:predicted amidophosphoribosyltransferase